MRVDGRLWDELRSVQISTSYVDFPEGSVLIVLGKTRVLCNATVEPSVPGWRLGSGSGWITAEYAMLPRATQERTRRETSGLSGRTQEIRRLIARSLRATVDLQRLGEQSIIVDCDVLQADGGTRTAAITGAHVALSLAVRHLENIRQVPPGVVQTEVAAVSLGFVEGELLLDLCYQEDSTAGADFNVVMTGDGRLVEVQGTAERATFTRRQMNDVLDLAERGIEQLLALQRQALGGAPILKV